MKTIRQIGTLQTHFLLSYSVSFIAGVLCITLNACQPQKESKISNKPISNTSKNTSTNQNEGKRYQRIITIGDAVTETVIALGDSNKIVAIGRTTPKFPEFQRPKVGYELTLQTKFILSHKPDLVISNSEASPEEIIDKVKEKGIEYIVLKPGDDLNSIKGFINKIAETLQKIPEAEKIYAKIDSQLEEVKKIRANRKDTAKVMYVLARGPGLLLMGGGDTSFDTVIELAGGKNVAVDVEGLQRVTESDMMTLNPNFLLMSHESYDSFKSKAYNMPVLYASVAYRFGKVAMLNENQLRSPGVDIGATALELAKILYEQQYFTPLVPANPTPGISTERSNELEIITPE